jgi:ribosomal protein S18 acetylase RimI-like enzyme
MDERKSFGEANIKIKRINSLRKIQNLHSQLIPLYKNIYSAHPDNQIWEEEFIKNLFEKYFTFGRIFFAFKEQSLIGFSVIISLSSSGFYKEPCIRSNIKLTLNDILNENIINLNECEYLADLGVDLNHRNYGLGTRLMNCCFDSSEKHLIFLRASTRKSNLIAYYNKLGFTSFEAYQYTKYKYLDGSEGHEEKIILFKYK